MRLRAFAYLSLGALTACSGAVAGDTGSADQDATGRHKGDHGAPSATFPAFTTEAPQIKNNGGSPLARPSIVTITWSSDPNAHTFEDFGDRIGGSAYWRAAVSCEFFDDSTYKETEPGFPFTVQRLWSNASAAAGHNPCVPLDGKAYFNVTPQSVETVSVLQPNHKSKDVLGYAVPEGKRKDIALGFTSDAATDAWTIAATEGDGMTTPKTKHLELSLDKTTGQNGEKAWLTVRAKSAGAKRGTLVTIVSTLGDTVRYSPILIQTN